MNSKIKIYRQQMIKLRQDFASLENLREQSPFEEQAKFSQGIVDICLEIERIENKICQLNRDTMGHVNQLRRKIMDALDQFNRWRKMMREMEKLFLVNFVRPGFLLKQAVRQREYLENSLMQLRQKIFDQEIHSLSELESEIHNVLSHADHAYETDDRSFEDEKIDTENVWNIIKDIEPKQILDEFREGRIERNFKRIVLPAVHPDTSDEPVEIFLTVKEIYEERDFLLMEAYIAQYQGEVALDEETDPLEEQDRLSACELQYETLSGRLDRRLEALKKQLTPDELEDPEKVKRLLDQQRDEIRGLIQEETEKIFNLRKMIMELIQLFITVNRGNKDD